MGRSRKKQISLHHLAIRAKRVELCADFYEKLLRRKPVRKQYDTRGHLRSVWFQLGEALLMIERAARVKSRGSKKHPPVEKGFFLLGFDIEAKQRLRWRERLRRLGVRKITESDFSLYFRDPEGNRLALSHYPIPTL